MKHTHQKRISSVEFKIVFLCTYRSPITRPITELHEQKDKENSFPSTVFRVEGATQQDHYKVKGYRMSKNI